MKKLIAAALLIVLTACTGVPQTDINNGINFAKKDLEAALTSAQSHNDRIAALCWQTLLDHIPNTADRVEPIGAISAYQDVRNARRLIQGTINDEDLKIGCAALVSDAKAVIAKLAGLAGKVGIPIP